MRADYNNNSGEELSHDDGRGDWPEPPNYRPLKLTIIGMVLAAVGAGAFLAWDDLIPVDHHARATEFLAAKNYASAVTELKHVIRENPRDGELRWIMGNAYLQLKQNADAAEYMQEAYDLGYRSPDLALALAQSKLMARDYKGVLELYEEWSDVAAGTGAAEWEVLRGRSLLNQGTLEESVTAFLEALRLNPNNSDAKKGLVESGLGANLPGLSEEEIERALSHGLDQPETWILRGERELSQGKMKEARASFEKAVEFGPDNVYALTGLLRTLIADNQLEDAREPAALLAKKFPADPMSAYIRALYAKRTEEYVQALDALKVVLDYEPDHAMSILLMGEVYFEMGNQELALEYLQLFHHLQPDSMLGRRQLAAILNESGSPKQAVELLEPLLEHSHRDPEIATILASAYSAMGDTQRATGYQSLFFKLGSVTSVTRIALEHLNSGDTEEAISKLELLVADVPEKVETRIMLAISLLRAGEYEKARGISEAILAERPKDPQAQYLHGSVLELSGDLDAAAQFYQRALALDRKYSMADLALARVEMNSGNHNKARQRIMALLERDASNPTAQVWMARMAIQDGDSEDAIARLEKLRSADKKALQPRLILADLYLQQGYAEKAMPVSSEIVKIIPDHPAGLYLLANAHLQAGNIDEGLAILERLEAANPESLQIKWQIVDAHEANENSAAVYDALQRILAVDPGSSRALVKLAMMGRLRGDEETAVALADHFAESHPESAMGYLIKGQILMDGEDYLSASRILGKAYATNKDSVTLSRYYTALAQAGEVGKAEKLMAGWLADHPDDNVARLAWADEASRAGNTARAVKQYERIALSEPNNVPVLVRLASSYQEMGDRRDLKTAQKAYELDSEDVYAKHLYGWLLVQTGLVERGTELLQDAVARAPNNATFRIHLASALAESGFEEDARITLQPLLNTDIKLADFSGAPALLEQLGIQPQ